MSHSLSRGHARSTLAATAALLLAFAACAGGSGKTTLVLYSPHGADLLGVVERAYEAAHPEIDIQWLDMGSQQVFDRIRSEKANPQADVWFGGPDTTLGQGAAQGLLAPYRPSWADAVPPHNRHPGDLFFGLYRTAPVLVYNRDAVSEADAPKDWDDLLAARFQGQVLMRDPLASGTLRAFFSLILARSVAATGNADRGWDWLRQLDGQTKEYVTTPALMIEKLARREGLVTVWELTDMLWQHQRGRPLAFRFPASGTPVIDDSIGLVAGAAHAEAAKVFIDWVGSPEAVELAAREAFRLPTRTDIPAEQLPEWAQAVLRDLKPAEIDRALVAGEAAGWMMTWDRTVRGRGRPRLGVPE